MEDYLNLLLEQIDKNQQICEFAKRERDAIAAGDMGIVMESDAMRREIIAQLQSLQSRMEPYLKALPHELEQVSPQLKAQLVTVCKQLDGIIRETIAIDQENEIKLRALKEGVGEKIEAIRKGKKALTGYKHSSRKAPKLFDGAV